MTIVLSCPYCLGRHDGERLCRHCGEDTSRDAIVELTVETLDRERWTTCVACGAKILALAARCRHCRAPQRADPSLLAEQIAYYRAVAPEYEQHALPLPGESELVAALEAFRPAGRVLELACGPGAWTARLLCHATSVTVVDASPEMLARARARVGEARVRFVQADLFAWAPDARHDVVFFGFWLSHVPLDRFERFWSTIADALSPGGRVFFVDDSHRTPEELIEGEASSTIQRRLADGTPYRAVKVPHRPADLEARLARLGWRITVTPTTGPFYWGAGTRAG